MEWQAPVLDGSIRSRSITAENPTGEPGRGGTAASKLGPGRKGKPCIDLDAGATETLAQISGPGEIRHIWITLPDRTPASAAVLRNVILRMYWDGNQTPSVEVPLGDFFCNGFATPCVVNSLPILAAPRGGLNTFFPLPFNEAATITLESQHPDPINGVFFQIDYRVYQDKREQLSYFHAYWSRTNGGGRGEDHVILDGVAGRGAYVGTYLAIAALERYWWGEGEVKFFIDDDTDYPTICGTGTEDYAAGAWAFRENLQAGDTRGSTFNSPFAGYPFTSSIEYATDLQYEGALPPQHGMYRWHLPDPIYFESKLRATVQRIGEDGRGNLFERDDDVSSVAYLYLDRPCTNRVPLPPAIERRPR